jgi:hypothetical protein
MVPTHPPAGRPQPVTTAAQRRRAGGCSPKRVGTHVTPEALAIASVRRDDLQLPVMPRPATRPRGRLTADATP